MDRSGRAQPRLSGQRSTESIVHGRFRVGKYNQRSSETGPSATPIGSIMSKLLARTGYAREQSSSQLEGIWEQVVPETLREKSRATTIKRGLLEVLVTHSALVQEMSFHKRKVIEQLTQLIPQAAISDIRCRVSADVGEPRS